MILPPFPAVLADPFSCRPIQQQAQSGGKKKRAHIFNFLFPNCCKMALEIQRLFSSKRNNPYQNGLDGRAEGWTSPRPYLVLPIRLIKASGRCEMSGRRRNPGDDWQDFPAQHSR
jgi:hypothetical protein